MIFDDPKFGTLSKESIEEMRSKLNERPDCNATGLADSEVISLYGHLIDPKWRDAIRYTFNPQKGK